MPRVDLEPVPFTCRVSQGGEELVWCLHGRPTVLADEVAVGAFGQMVGSWAVAEVGVDDYAQLLQLLEVPIDGGQSDIRCLGLDRLGQLFSRPVARTVEQCLEEQPPGAGDPAAVLANQSQHVFHGVDLMEVIVDGDGPTHSVLTVPLELSAWRFRSNGP